jgi:hypothetical protein
MGELAEKVIAKLRERIVFEADSIGVDMVADIRDHISTPVQRFVGGVVIRSAPGEDPFLDKGHLWESERHEVIESGPVIELNIINDAAYARRLHDGHDNVEPRPFHDLAMDRWRPLIAERIRDAVVGL